jgi:parallel beta-helix repeat protein
MYQFRVAGCLAALAIAAPAIGEDSNTVDCSNGGTIREALASKARKDKLVLRVQGICREGVVIDRDDVTLEGDGSGATIIGSVTIDGGRRAMIARLTITNPTGDGVTVENGASATIRDNHIVNNGAYGLLVRNAAFALVNHNTLSHNGQTNTAGSGIGLFVGSTARGLKNVIEGNAFAGIEVADNSTYRSEGDLVTAAPAARAALNIYRASFADMRGTSVTGLVDLNQQSYFQVRNAPGFDTSNVTGQILVSGGFSYLRLRSGVLYTGPLNCLPVSICFIDP